MKNLQATIFNIMKYSIHDGPGIRTTVFFKGCPLRCQWCHNPESISPEPQELFYENKCVHCGRCDEGLPCLSGARETVGYTITANELMEKLRRDNIFYEQSGGGVTFSGGEPFYQREFLIEMLKRCKDELIHTAVDTSGFTRTEFITEAAKYAGLFLYDIKFASSDKHEKYTGVPNTVILENLRTISGMTKIFVRIPVIPGINDDKEEMTKICLAIKGLAIDEVNLLPYHNIQTEKYKRLGQEYLLNDVPSGDTADLEGLRALFGSYGFKTKIGG